MPTPNFELLKDAYAIIDGLPDENVNLNSWRRTDCGATCGTIACAAGWLSLHPQFEALGLRYDKGRENIVLDQSVHYGWAALAQVFSLTNSDAQHLFRGAYLEPVRTHREIFLERVRTFLSDHGQLKEQLAEVQHAS